MKRLHVIFLALIALFAFSSCSDDDDKNNDSNSIVGKWKLNGKSVSIDCSDAAIKAIIASNYEDISLPNAEYEFFDNGKFKFTEAATESSKGDNEEGEYTLNSRGFSLVPSHRIQHHSRNYYGCVDGFFCRAHNH